MKNDQISKYLLTNLLLLLSTGLALAQPIDKSHITYANAFSSLEQLKQVLAIPNDANQPEDIEKNVQWCEAEFRKAGFVSERLETPTVPLLLAEYAQEAPGQPTVLFYHHKWINCVTYIMFLVIVRTHVVTS